MNTKEYVQSLFTGYEESGNLKDFMEELQSNLDARIASLACKGISESEAFDKACAELGDISALADELSLKKRKEVFENAYMGIRGYMSPRRVAAYILFGLAALFGVIAAISALYASSYFDFDGPAWLSRGGWRSGGLFRGGLGTAAFIGTLLPFIVAATAGFTFLGLTQETESDYPMSAKRAAWYTLAAAALCFGLIVALLVFFSVETAGNGAVSGFGIMAAAGTLIPFALPGGGLLAYLVLTEKDRRKPWMRAAIADAVQRDMKLWNDPVTASRFGMFSGAIWIFAVALFLLFGFLAGFQYSWLVFLFAAAVQLLVQGFMVQKKER